MVADLDHLKQINDQYGHAAGDTVLVEVSRRLNTNLRAIDLVARMGGEEFLIIMPETKQGEAETAGKRLCNLIHDTPIELANGKCQVSVSISIGVALGGGSNDPRQSAAQVLDLADRALYGSKSEGRNRVTQQITRPDGSMTSHANTLVWQVSPDQISLYVSSDGPNDQHKQADPHWTSQRCDRAIIPDQTPVFP